MGEIGDDSKTFRELFSPITTNPPSCIVLPVTTTAYFELKPQIIHLLPTFHGLDREDPYMHVKDFLEICATCKFQNFSDDSVRLRLFPFSLKDKAKAWLNSLSPGSITSWELLTQTNRNMIESMNGDGFLSLMDDEAYKFLENLSESSQQCDFSNRRERSAPAIKKRGLYEVSEDLDIKARLDNLTRKVEALGRGMNSVNQVQCETCSICASPMHTTQMCPSIVGYLEYYTEQANALNNYGRPLASPFSETYNPNWQNHPNFSWRQNHSPTNIGGQQSITTLRFDKQVDNQVKMPEVEDNENTVLWEKGVHNSQDNLKEKKGNLTSILIQDLSSPLDKRFVPKTLFPQSLINPQKSAQFGDILEDFKQVQINIPFLDAIQQVPAYAKFLKDLVTMKRKTNVPKKAFLTEQLGLGELKPTTMTLQLADRSVKIPRGIIEDVLIKVDAFYFPVDFVVLDTEPALNASTQIHVILGRPFLATSNALINCRSGVMKISFGNMTVELNIFDISKQVNALLDSIPLLSIDSWQPKVVPFPLSSPPLPSIVEPPKLDDFWKHQLISILQVHKEAIGWKIADIKGIRISVVMQRIHLEDTAKDS
nr:uncharacterized protein LOC112024125 [Quercus suber]